MNIVAVNQSSGFPVNFRRSFRAITGIAPAFMGLVGVHSFYPAMANLPNQITVASTTPDHEYWFDNDHAWPGNGWLRTGHGKETVHLAAPSYTTPNATIGSFGTHVVNEQGELEEADEFLYTREELRKDLGLVAGDSLESLGALMPAASFKNIQA